MSFLAWADRFDCWTAFGASHRGREECWALKIAQVIIKYRATDDALKLVEHILKPLGSRYVYLSYEDHDVVTANTQAVTHAAFLRYASPHLFLLLP